MRDWPSPSHVRWYGKYHMVCVPKCRRRVSYGQLQGSLGRIIRALCQPQGVAWVEGHAMPEHMPLGLRMPPKLRVANPVGWLTGKSAIRIHRACVGRERNVTGLPCWARGSCVSTVGLDEHVIREDLRNQEQEEQRQEELQLQGLSPLAEEVCGS
ncbi:MAG: IS200/IS605 family transposase [Candidatus Tectimicrobiota bacterium]